MNSLTKWAVLTLLSRYFFWAAMFCALLGSPFLPPPLFLPLFKAGLFFMTPTDSAGDGEGEYSSTSTSGVGDFAGIPFPCPLLPDVTGGLGIIAGGGRYSDEVSSSTLESGLGYRLTGWGFVTRKFLMRRGLTHSLIHQLYCQGMTYGLPPLGLTTRSTPTVIDSTSLATPISSSASSPAGVSSWDHSLSGESILAK